MSNNNKKVKNNSIWKMVIKNPLTIVVAIFISIFSVILIITYLLPYIIYNKTPDTINKEYILHRVERFYSIKDKEKASVLRIKNEDIKIYNEMYKEVNVGDYIIKSGAQIVIYDDFNNVIKYKN